MKKNILILMAGMLLGTATQAQTAKELFRKNNYEYRWLGIDYTQVKLIGDFADFFSAGEKTAHEIQNEYFPRWNRLILSEPSKYDVAGMFRKSRVDYDIDMVMFRNREIDIYDLEAYNTPFYKKDHIKKVVQSYDIQDKTGIGVVMIAESLNKTTEMAIYHVVALNMETKEVLFSERIMARPAGFGLRNYWGGSIHDAIEKTTEDFPIWKMKYS